MIKLFKTSANNQVRLKCIEYATTLKDETFLDEFKEEVFSHDIILCYLILKYFISVKYYDDLILIFSFFYTDNLLIKKQVIDMYKTHYCNDFSYVSKGLMSDDFHEVMKLGLDEWLMNSSEKSI